MLTLFFGFGNLKKLGLPTLKIFSKNLLLLLTKLTIKCLEWSSRSLALY